MMMMSPLRSVCAQVEQTHAHTPVWLCEDALVCGEQRHFALRIHKDIDLRGAHHLSVKRVSQGVRTCLCVCAHVFVCVCVIVVCICVCLHACVRLCTCVRVCHLGVQQCGYEQ
jgi:hypothetical protein